MISDKDLIPTKDIRDELGISTTGLDKNIKSRDIQKHKNSLGQVCILKTDYECIKKAVELRGRVKKVQDKDHSDRELASLYEQSKKEKDILVNDINILNVNLHNAEDKITGLTEDKQVLQEQLATATDNLATTQKLLSQEQELHLKEKQLREQLEDKLRSNKLLLDSADNEKHILEEKINIAESKAKELEDRFNELLKEKEKSELKFNESLIEKEEELKKLEDTRISTEIAITKVSEYENMRFLRRLKFAITGK